MSYSCASTRSRLMILKDAFPSLRIEGKPQCHIIAIAMESGEIAASVGSALSRARTGMRSDELTCRDTGIAARRHRAGHRDSRKPGPRDGQLRGR